MLIACPSCATTYQIELAALGPAGRSVRCSHCRSTWFATQGDALAATAAAMEADIPAPEPTPDLPAVIAPPETMPDGVWMVPEAPPPETSDVTTLDQAPSIAPYDAPDAASPPEPEAGAPEAIETIAARRARRVQADRASRRSLVQRVASVPMLIVALIAVLGAAIHWRTAVVRHVPQTASLFTAVGLPVNLRGLVFQDVKSVTEPQDGMPVLVIEGTIVNVTSHTLEVPRLRFALRNATGQEIYAWTVLAAKPQLGSGNGLAFRTRLASPPAEGRDVVVRFFNRRDVTAGLQ